MSRFFSLQKILTNIFGHPVCLFCNSDQYVKKSFSKKPCWLLIQNLVRSYKKKLTTYDLPSHLILDNYKYILLMTTYNVGAHFKSIVNLNDCFYGFDDMKNGLEETIQKHFVSSCFYYLSNKI